MQTFIEFQNVTLFSGDYSVLKDITVNIPDNKCTVVLGPSGCGKSSFLKVAAGIYPPDKGRVLARGKDLAKYSYKLMKVFRKNTGYVFEDSALWANCSLYENLALPLRFHNKKLKEPEVKARVLDLLSLGGFANESHLRPEQLSVSERKVIAFFRGIVTNPSHLFMDEPVQSMDHELAGVIADIMKKMKAENKTLVLVTTKPDLTSQMADHLIILKEGEVVAAGEFDVVKNSTNPVLKQILYEILGQAATFDTDILNLLND